jgi:hypothetical protein
MLRNWNVRLVALALVALLPGAAFAQAPVTESDIARLEAVASEIGTSVTALEKTDATLAAEVRRSLTPLREEVTYLKVKLRRDGTVTRSEYGELRDKLETLRLRAQGTVTSQPVQKDDPAGRIHVVPVGTLLDVRLQTPLNSGRSKVEERFEATTVADYVMDGATVIPAGSIVRGFVSSVRAAGHIDRKGSLTLSFDEIRIANRTYRLRATVEQALDAKAAQDATRIGAGAVIGGIIGGLLGGGKGALAGVLIGGGGTIAATEGTDVDLPVGTVLRIRIDQALEIVGLPGGSGR